MRFTRITIEPGKMGGAPCIRGLRFPVATVLRLVARGMTVQQILDEHPDLEADDIPEALHFAAEAMNSVEMPVGTDAVHRR
jgi:uncharacterized protein (DUF433 family)